MLTKLDPSAVVPDFDEKADLIRAIAPQGFVLALDMGWAGPRYWRSEVLEEWKEIYITENLFISDPVFYFARLQTGQKRWSDLLFKNSTSFMTRAAQYGMKYGAIVSKKRMGRKSFLSVAHDQREFSDNEIEIASIFLEMCMKTIAPKVVLTEKEIDVLHLLRDGFSQSDIAKELEISQSTVKQRCGGFMRKLKARTRSQAVGKAIEMGLLD